MSESDEQFQTRVDAAFYNFFRAHWREGLSSCLANRAALENYMDEHLLDASKGESIEIAFVATNSCLAHTATPEAPEPPAPVAVAAEPELSEEAKLRQILQDEKDPKVIASKMRGILKTKDAHAKNRRTKLPTQITPEALNSDRFLMRRMADRFGFEAVNARLQGRG